MATLETSGTNDIIGANEVEDAGNVAIEQIPIESDDKISPLQSRDSGGVGCDIVQCDEDLLNHKAFKEVSIEYSVKENGMKHATNHETIIEVKMSQPIEDKLRNCEENVDKDFRIRKSSCVVCKKLTRCQFVFIDKKNKKYLCGSSCFAIFKIAPESYQQNSEEPEQLNRDLKKIPSCITCGSHLTPDKAFKTPKGANGFKKFCTYACYAQYQQFIIKNGSPEMKDSYKIEKCVICGSLIKDLHHMIRFKKMNHNFCSTTCINTFKAKNEAIEECSWCKESRTNFDMIVDPQSPNKFCCLNCLAMYNVKLQASISTPSCCGNCNKTRTLNYHLKMSDLSLRCFCSYPCVKTFCNKFSRNSSKLSGPFSKTPRQTSRSAVANSVVVEMPQLQSKSLLCKPLACGKSTSCMPQMNDMETQTDEDFDSKAVVPYPTPVMMPTSLCNHIMPTSLPALMPFPIPVHCFVPTNKKSSEKIPKISKELPNKVPSNAFEAELLVVADVAGNNQSDRDSSDEGKIDQPANPITSEGKPEEDMLQLALRVADEMSQDDPDLLDSSLADDQQSSTNLPGMSIDSQIPEDMLENNLGKGQKRKNANVGDKVAISKNTENINGTKRHRKEGLVSDATKEQISDQTHESSEVYANIFALKYSYGVNAYKYWVLKKNAEIEATHKNAICTSSSLTKKGPRFFKLDLLQASSEELNQALSYFVKEVRKPNGEEYAPDSILYLCLGIQHYMHMFGRVESIFTDSLYEKFSNTLNEVLIKYEVRLDAQGMLVCRIEEEHLWECKQLGAHSPHVLINTLIYFNTKYFLLRSQQHLKLSFAQVVRQCRRFTNHPNKQGKGTFLRYCPTAASSESNKKRKDDPSALEQSENLENPMRCPIKLYEFYISKCPESIKNKSDMFYLVPEISCIPDSPVWFTSQPYSPENLAKIFNRLQLVREIQETLLSGMTSCLR